jgi:hypothetical protein
MEAVLKHASHSRIMYGIFKTINYLIKTCNACSFLKVSKTYTVFQVQEHTERCGCETEVI